MQSEIPRSYLFVPATRTDRIAKAQAAGPDAVIVDLEDAVAPSEKVTARDALARDLPDASSVLVRINGGDSEWFEEDLRLCAAIRAGGVVLAKAERAEHIEHVARSLGEAAVILPLVETARGFADLSMLCGAPQVQRVVFGSIDFQVDLGITGEGEELLYFRSGLVLASRLAGIQAPIDGVTVEIDDADRLREETLRGKRLGFGGKLCIHPKQVAVVNACFCPTEQEISWARRIRDAAERAKGSAVAVDGKMIDRPVMLKAEQIIRESERRPKRQPTNAR
jgi:citrate lyase subunit beta/citryl-CoA lyase